MKSAQVTASGRIEWVDAPEHTVTMDDVLLKIKACSICGSDAIYTNIGGFPPGREPRRLSQPGAKVAIFGAGPVRRSGSWRYTNAPSNWTSARRHPH